jgi:regulator of cell morphogenesis and NO signaling
MTPVIGASFGPGYVGDTGTLKTPGHLKRAGKGVHMDSRFEHGTIGDIVAANYRAAAVFERHGLDFCCGGRASLAEACRQRNADVGVVVAELDRLDTVDDAAPSDPAGLIAHIVAKHHAYILEAIPTIKAHLAKLVAVHGAGHPELQSIAGNFETVSGELRLHMMKEERVLFPYIVALADAAQNGNPAPPDMFGSVQNPIRMMESEHQQVGSELAVIRVLSSDYTPPAEACSTYRVTYDELREFEHDLHRHVHLENNVLFPKAVALEAQANRRGHIGCESPR